MGVPADAANILKSALSKGEVQIIGATTSSEYRQFIQEDEALARRFKPVYIEEPTKEEAREIVYGIKPRLEYNYGVEISDEAIDVLLNMSDRYLRNTKLPDKVIGWLHTSCVKVELDKPDEPVVKPENVLEVVAQESKLPIDMVYRDTLDRFKELEAHLSGRVVGQREAIAAVTRHLRVNKGPLKENFSRPDAVMLFLGPTGVGKTELAKVLAEFLFGDENRMVRVDMSEFRDGAISVDKLIGMPRGIVGSERGGILTNRVKDNPYSLVLLDEMEKASQEVLNLFLQVFDEGWLTDGRGRRVYFSDTVIVMTSNIGADRFKKLLKPMGFMGEQGQLADAKKAVMRDVEDAFSPEFLNRMDDIIVFNPLTPDEIRAITRMYLDSITGQMASMHKKLRVSEEAVDMLSKEGYSIKYGARFLKRSIDEKVKMPVTLNWKASSEFFVEVQEGRVAVRWD
jgi:ATP-dependent Clp protease ATP-binding subunit ClpA